MAAIIEFPAVLNGLTFATLLVLASIHVMFVGLCVPEILAVMPQIPDFLIINEAPNVAFDPSHVINSVLMVPMVDVQFIVFPTNVAEIPRTTNAFDTLARGQDDMLIDAAVSASDTSRR